MLNRDVAQLGELDLAVVGDIGGAHRLALDVEEQIGGVRTREFHDRVGDRDVKLAMVPGEVHTALERDCSGGVGGERLSVVHGEVEFPGGAVKKLPASLCRTGLDVVAETLAQAPFRRTRELGGLGRLES